MSYRVEISQRAARQLRSLAEPVRERVIRAAYSLGSNPRPAGVTKLEGSTSEWRIRVGDYRVIYEIRDDVLVVLVVQVGHRREIYRRR